MDRVAGIASSARREKKSGVRTEIRMARVTSTLVPFRIITLELNRSCFVSPTTCLLRMRLLCNVLVPRCIVR